MVEGDDELLFGAAMPAIRQRRSVSLERLDAVWVVALAMAFIGSSFVHLVDFSTVSLRTGTQPYRVFAVGVPMLAIAAAAVGAVQRSRRWVGVATGTLAPAVGFIGIISSSLFLSDDAAFTEVGVVVSLAVAILAAVVLARWFVYRGEATDGAEGRPIRQLAWALGVAGGLVAVSMVVFWARNDGGFSLADVVALAFALLVPVTVAVAAAVRTGPAFAVAAAAAAAGLAAVLIARFDTPDGVDLDLEQGLGLWLGVPGLVLLGLACAIGVAGQFAQHVDEPDADGEVGAETWRWSVDD